MRAARRRHDASTTQPEVLETTDWKLQSRVGEDQRGTEQRIALTH